jgi:SAM-dependent methyltransferase
VRGFDPDAVASSYDRVAGDYAAQFLDELSNKPFDRQLIDDFAALVADRGVVCDLGCGPGHVARYLADRGVQVRGIDLSDAMVVLAREHNPDLSFEQGDARHLAVEDASWSAIVAFYSLIHLRRDGLDGVLTELRRTLEPRGLLLVAVHGGTGQTHLDEWFGRPVELSATFFERAELVQAFEAAGFTVDHAVERPPYEFELQTRRIYILGRRP